MGRPKFYITTAIDYPNARPHIGTAFEKIGADVQARYRRMRGYDVTFLMGNDEHALKVAEAAAQQGLDTREYCNRMADEFKAAWKLLDISYDDFIQTSEERHVRGVEEFFRRAHENGHIYLKEYQGKYCDGCEEFKTDKDLQDGRCPNHPARAIREVAEENYFFRLSAFEDELKRRYAENPTWLEPERCRNEVLGLLESGLQDVSVSRKGFSWGVRVPFDPTHTVYVWFDALINYASGAGFGVDEDRFARLWPADVHVIGKDITRFHSVIWPAMLLAAGIELPRRVYAHGFVYFRESEETDREKISKSGRFLAPDEVLRVFDGHPAAADAYRFYFLRECNFPADGEFSEQRFFETYNSALANNLGNLYSRVGNLVIKHFDGLLPPGADSGAAEVLGDDLDKRVDEIQADIEAFRYAPALRAVWALLDAANEYIDRTEPFRVVKTDKQRGGEMLAACLEVLRVVAILAAPFIPRTAEIIHRALGVAPTWKDCAHDDARIPRALAGGAPFQPERTEKGRIVPLFPRIER